MKIYNQIYNQTGAPYELAITKQEDPPTHESSSRKTEIENVLFLAIAIVLSVAALTVTCHSKRNSQRRGDGESPNQTRVNQVTPSTISQHNLRRQQSSQTSQN